MASAWTFIAQRATTREFLDWDVPLELDSMAWALSGPGSLQATVAPDVGGLRGSDGRLLLEEWGTLLFAESDGEIRWGGILVSSSFDDEVWKIEAAGFATYPHAITFESELVGTQLDPLQILRTIWAHVQSYPDSDLGVQVTGATSSPVRLGVVGTEGDYDNKVIAATEIVERIESGEPYFEDWTWHGCSDHVLYWNDPLMDEFEQRPHPKATETAWLHAFIEAHPPVKTEPYELVWWDSPNCGDEIDDLAKTTPFDYREVHRWSPDHESILHEIEVGYPRLGRRRHDILFDQGTNVTEVVSVESNGDDFANVVTGLGAGEGRSMVRRQTVKPDGRLRRVATFADKAVTDAARLDALIAEELNARRAALRITSIDVVDHSHARIGDWQIGDDVLVRAELPWLGEIEMWCRITGWSLTGEDTASLDLVRSDFFSYGGPTS